MEWSSFCKQRKPIKKTCPPNLRKYILLIHQINNNMFHVEQFKINTSTHKTLFIEFFVFHILKPNNVSRETKTLKKQLLLFFCKTLNISKIKEFKRIC